MGNAANAKVEIELSQTFVAMAEMTDSGDHQYYTISGGTLWSGKSGYTPDVRPNGIVTGKGLLSSGTTNDTVRIAAFTAYSKGALQTVAATKTTITRSGTSGAYQVHSITMASDGSVAVVEGAVSATEFASTRASNGGPPLIPVNSVEIGQIRVSSSTAAAISAGEIKQVIGTHTERYDYPVWTEFNIGLGDAASVSAQRNAHVKFASALPAIHTGSVPKEVWMSYYTPEFSELQKATDFSPVENTHSIQSQQYYRGTVGSVSSAMGQGGFTVFLDDGVTDAILGEKDQFITTRFYPDEDKAPYLITQGKFGMTRTFPVDNQIQAVVTITAEEVTAEFQS